MKTEITFSDHVKCLADQVADEMQILANRFAEFHLWEYDNAIQHMLFIWEVKQ